MVAHCQVGGRSACAIVFSGSASTSPSSMTQISVRRKGEPSYFDSRRGWNAQSLDIGFAPDSLTMTTMACPAVEFLCLVGLQRFRPASTTHRRVFVDHAWLDPRPVSTAAVAASGTVWTRESQADRFENAFRPVQKKHKSFLLATPMGDSS